MSTQVEERPVNETIRIDQAKVADFRAQSLTLVVQARDFTIDNPGDYEFSLTMCEDAIKRQKAIGEFFAPAKKAAFELHRLITGMENDLLATYKSVEELIKQRRLIWRKEQEAERMRVEASTRRVAKEEADARALADAAVLEKEGQHEAAAEVLQQAVEAPAPAVVVQSSVPKQAGSAVRKKFSYRIDDDSKVPREFCSPDPKKLKSHVDTHGMNAKIAGVTVYPDETESVRTKGR